MASRTANGKAGERIVLVDETQADRPTIEAYELITRKLRVPRVPLFFRALAGEKALLPCWQALRPAVRLRAFEEGADELRARAARLGTAGGGRETPRGLQRVPRGVPHEMDIVELVPEEANGTLARVFRSIRTHIGLGVVADDFRAFARWPKYLNIAWDDARKRGNDPRARAALADLWGQAEAAVSALPVKVSVSAAQISAAGADPARVRTLVERFRRATPGLVLDLAQFKVQLDGAEDSIDSPFPVRWKYINPEEYMQVGLDEPVKLRAGDPVSLEED
jgi:hypothetical protein